jgi:hypothetical protein
MERPRAFAAPDARPHAGAFANDQTRCESEGCCHWNAGQCWSSVGAQPCADGGGWDAERPTQRPPANTTAPPTLLCTRVFCQDSALEPASCVQRKTGCRDDAPRECWDGTTPLCQDHVGSPAAAPPCADGFAPVCADGSDAVCPWVDVEPLYPFNPSECRWANDNE